MASLPLTPRRARRGVVCTRTHRPPPRAAAPPRTPPPHRALLPPAPSPPHVFHVTHHTHMHATTCEWPRNEKRRGMDGLKSFTHALSHPLSSEPPSHTHSCRIEHGRTHTQLGRLALGSFCWFNWPLRPPCTLRRQRSHAPADDPTDFFGIMSWCCCLEEGDPRGRENDEEENRKKKKNRSVTKTAGRHGRQTHT